MKVFEEWKKDNDESLQCSYRDYLKNTVLDDNNFDITTTEDFYTWIEEEYDMLKEDETKVK